MCASPPHDSFPSIDKDDKTKSVCGEQAVVAVELEVSKKVLFESSSSAVVAAVDGSPSLQHFLSFYEGTYQNAAELEVSKKHLLILPHVCTNALLS